MGIFRIVFVLLVFSFLLSFTPAFADDELIIHGLVSQGFLKSSENNYMSYSEDGTSEFHETIINFQKQMDDKTRLGVQFISKDLGQEGNHQVKIDWAYGDYRFNDRWGLRLGRVKVPFGLYNKYRDIDMLRTPVMLPATVYMEDYRQYITAFNGGVVYANLPAGKGDFELEFAYGTSDMDPDSGIVKDIFLRYNAAYAANIDRGIIGKLGALGVPAAAATAAVTKAGHFGDPERDGNGKAGYAAKLLWNTPVEGLRLSGTRTFVNLNMNETMTMQSITQTGLPAPVPATLLNAYQADVDIRYRFWVDIGSFEYNVNKFTFAGEFMAAHGKQNITQTNNSLNTNPAPGIPNSFTSVAQTSQGTYLQGVYRHNSRHEWSLYRGEFFFDRNNKNWMTWQKDTCASFKYNINPNWSVKLEHHWMDGVALVQKNLNPNGLDRKWNLIAFKTTYNF